MLDETRHNTDKARNPYLSYEGLFCKVLLTNFREGRPIKGMISIVSGNLLRIKGDFLDTTVNIDQIALITTKINDEVRKWGIK